MEPKPGAGGSWEQRFIVLSLFLPSLCAVVPIEDRGLLCCGIHVIPPFTSGSPDTPSHKHARQQMVRDSEFMPFSEEIADWPTLVQCLCLIQSAVARGGPSWPAA